MSLESIRDAIEQLRDGNPAAFSQSIKDVLMSKLSNRMDVEKVSVASQMFGDAPEPQVPSEASNEQ